MNVCIPETEQRNQEEKSENGQLQEALAEQQRSNDLLREKFEAFGGREVPSTSSPALPPAFAAPTFDASAQQNADGILPYKKPAAAASAVPVTAVSKGRNKQSEFVSTFDVTSPGPSKERTQDEEAVCCQRGSNKRRHSDDDKQTLAGGPRITLPYVSFGRPWTARLKCVALQSVPSPLASIKISSANYRILQTDLAKPLLEATSKAPLEMHQRRMTALE